MDQIMVNTAIILAFDDEGTEPVFGVPAARRLVLVLGRLGLDNIHLVGQVNPYIPILSDLLPRSCFHALAKEKPLETLVHELEGLRAERMMVLKANHVADKHSLAHFIRYGESSAVCCVAANSADESGDGIYLVDRCHLPPLIHSLWSQRPLDPSILGDVRCFQSINGLPCVVSRRALYRGLPEETLVNALAKQTEADDGFIARHFDRRISRFISKRIANTRLAPNHITLAGMSIGLVGAFLLSRPGYWPKLIGSLLFVFCVIVDGVDGEVARLKLKESTFGHYLDIVTDNIVHAAIFAGIAFGLYHDTGNAGYLRFLWVLMGGFGVCLVAVYQCILRLDSEALERSPRTLRIMALVTNRDFAYLVFLLALIGRLDWFLVGAAIGSYLFAIALWGISFHEKRRAPASSSNRITGEEQISAKR
jgi:phosphatidylglycerophosphate synthase